MDGWTLSQVIVPLWNWSLTMPYMGHKVETQYRWDTLAFIHCITKTLESSKSYICKIYVGNIGAYPRQTSIIVLQ
jgi:hypothetical protein